MHGFPSSHLEAVFLAEEANRQGFFLVSYDRPGYGETSVSLSHTQSFSRVPFLISDHLGFQKIHLIGTSGGAPTAISSALEFSERVLSLTVICGLAPYADEFKSAFPKIFKVGFAAVEKIPEFALKKILMFPKPKLKITHRAVEQIAKKVVLAPKDYPFVQSKEFYQFIAESSKVSKMQDNAGVIADLSLFATDWWQGRQIQVPSTFWHGRKDKVLPFKMSDKWKEKQPQICLKILEDEGHYSLPLGNAREILLEIPKFYNLSKVR